VSVNSWSRSHCLFQSS